MTNMTKKKVDKKIYFNCVRCDLPKPATVVKFCGRCKDQMRTNNSFNSFRK